MRSVLALLLVAVVLCGAAPLLHTDNPNVINGSYIVVLKENTELTARDSHIMDLLDAIAMANDESSIRFRYNIGSFIGFAASLTEKFLQIELNHPDVLFIEADQIMKADYSTQNGATWGISRTSAPKALPSSLTTYYYNSSAGANVDVFVIDTGIYTAHSDFGGRASAVYNAIPGESGQDLNGHGTHCSGTIGGTTYGIAKKVNLKGVKVLDKQGSGTNSGVIDGVNYVTNNVGKNPAVASMSLGGGPSTALDTAVAASIQSGIPYAIAAGNDNKKACDYSPARVATAVTVGATTKKDVRASFSNYGLCVDIFAPGQDITSDWIGSTTATNTISGTSMATPHVAGVIALHRSYDKTLTPAQLGDLLTADAYSGIVTSPGTGSPNFLLHATYV